MNTAISVFVPGIPRPQGSKNAYNRGGKIILVDAANGLKDWRFLIALMVHAAAEKSAWTLTHEEICITCRFLFTPPKRPTRTYPPRNDTDKLLRAVFDAVTQASNVWVDDDQATIVHARKEYALDGRPGVDINISEAILKPASASP